MGGDRLVFEVQDRRFCLDTSDVASIVEASNLSFIPGQAGFVRGVISLRGEPVAVIDAHRIFGGTAPDAKPGVPARVVVVGDGKRTLGLYIGTTKPYFLWAEEISGYNVSGTKERYVDGRIEAGDDPIDIIDWTVLFEDAAKALATEQTGA